MKIRSDSFHVYAVLHLRIGPTSIGVRFVSPSIKGSGFDLAKWGPLVDLTHYSKKV